MRLFLLDAGIDRRAPICYILFATQYQLQATKRRTMEQIIFTIATFFSTMLGGLFGIRFRDRLHLILGFTAGVLLGVVCFDILPEIIDQVKERNFDTTPPMIAIVVGFLLFHIIEKLNLLHHAHGGHEDEYAPHQHQPTLGVISALALAAHSFMDGVGIGLGFQVNDKTGIIVAIAVISHDFADGLNTVSLMLVNKNTIRRALLLLAVDALAPVLGVASTFLFSFPPEFLVVYLGFFAGFLLYIGGSDILPEAHSNHSSVATLVLTVVGAVFIFVVTRAT